MSHSFWLLAEKAVHYLEILTPADESQEQFADEGNKISSSCQHVAVITLQILG